MSTPRCPIEGLTPEAQVEIAAFEDHLQNHRPHSVEGCRFCDFRKGSMKAICINAECTAPPGKGDTP